MLRKLEHQRSNTGTEKEEKLGTERAAELQKIVDEFIVRRTNDLLAKHLPDKVVSVVCVKLTPLQQKLYEHLLAAKLSHYHLTGKHTGTNIFLLSIGNDKTLNNNNNNRNVTKCKRPEKGVQSSESCLYRCSTCQKLQKHDGSTRSNRIDAYFPGGVLGRTRWTLT